MSAYSVLFLTESLNVGGTEIFVEKLLSRLDAQTFRPIVCCLVEKGTLAPLLEARGVPVFALGCNLKSKRSAVSTTLRLARLLRAERVDLVQTFFYRAEILGAFAGVLARTPVVVASQYDMLAPRRKLPRLLLRSSRAMVAHVIANCEACRNRRRELTGLGLDRISVIYMGLTREELEPGVPPEHSRITQGYFDAGPVVTYAGRLYHVKGPDVFLRAAAVLSRAHAGVRFLMLGDGPMREELASLARQLGIGDRVEMPGEMRPVNWILSKSSVFVCSSRSEGFPNVILEAMAASVPVVASRVGGVEELIRHGADGFVFANENWEELALWVGRVLSDRRLAADVASRAREKVLENFRFEETVKRIGEVYGRLIADSRRYRGRASSN